MSQDKAYTVVCSECGSVLNMTQVGIRMEDGYNVVEIKVQPCERCVKEAWDKGRCNR